MIAATFMNLVLMEKELEHQFLATAWIQQGRARHRVRTRISGLAGKPKGRVNIFSSG